MPSSSANQELLLIPYHRIKETVAWNAIWFIHVNSKYGYSDILAKPLPKTDNYSLANGLLRW